MKKKIENMFEVLLIALKLFRHMSEIKLFFSYWHQNQFAKVEA